MCRNGVPDRWVGDDPRLRLARACGAAVLAMAVLVHPAALGAPLDVEVSTLLASGGPHINAKVDLVSGGSGDFPSAWMFITVGGEISRTGTSMPHLGPAALICPIAREDPDQCMWVAIEAAAVTLVAEDLWLVSGHSSFGELRMEIAMEPRTRGGSEGCFMFTQRSQTQWHENYSDSRSTGRASGTIGDLRIEDDGTCRTVGTLNGSVRSTLVMQPQLGAVPPSGDSVRGWARRR